MDSIVVRSDKNVLDGMVLVINTYKCIYLLGFYTLGNKKRLTSAKS